MPQESCLSGFRGLPLLSPERLPYEELTLNPEPLGPKPD